MKVTVLMWLMPQWISYRWVVYLLTSGQPNDSESVYQNSISHLRLARNFHNTIWQPLFRKGACSSYPRYRWKSRHHTCTVLFSPFLVRFRSFSSVLVRSQRLSNTYTLSPTLSKLSSIFMRFYNSRVLLWILVRYRWLLRALLDVLCQFSCVLVKVVVLVLVTPWYVLSWDEFFVLTNPS